MSVALAQQDVTGSGEPGPEVGASKEWRGGGSVFSTQVHVFMHWEEAELWLQVG